MKEWSYIFSRQMIKYSLVNFFNKKNESFTITSFKKSTTEIIIKKGNE